MQPGHVFHQPCIGVAWIEQIDPFRVACGAPEAGASGCSGYVLSIESPGPALACSGSTCRTRGCRAKLGRTTRPLSSYPHPKHSTPSASVCTRKSSLPSTPSSCANAPIGPNSASCSSPAIAKWPWSMRRPPGLDLAPLGRLLADTAVHEGVPCGAAGHRNLRAEIRRRAAAAVRHPGGGDGGGFRRPGRLRRAGVGAHRRSYRQGAPLQRLVGAAAIARADHLRRRRRHLSARRLPQAARAAASRKAGSTGSPRRWRCSPIRQRIGPIPIRCGSGCGRAPATGGCSACCGPSRAGASARRSASNIPRQRMLKDEALLEIAATAPDTAEALARARGVSRGFAEGRTGASLLAAIAEAKALPEEALPPAPVSRGRAAALAGPGIAAEGAARGEMRGAPCRAEAGGEFRRYRPAGERGRA